MAFRACTSSPIAARRLVTSRRLRPASTRIRVRSVATNVALPELLLASTQTLTMAEPLDARPSVVEPKSPERSPLLDHPPLSPHNRRRVVVVQHRCFFRRVQGSFHKRKFRQQI